MNNRYHLTRIRILQSMICGSYNKTCLSFLSHLPTTGTGRYYVLVHVKLGFADLGSAGKRINTKTMYIVHEYLE
ncbi:MAG: hypothetical protein WBV84_00625 [Nitrososphaeraceae archaeon]